MEAIEGKFEIEVYLDEFGGLSIKKVPDLLVIEYLRTIQIHWLRDLLPNSHYDGQYILTLEFSVEDDLQDIDIVDIRKCTNTLQ